MPRLTKSLIARNERIEKVIRSISEDLGVEHANALGHFAAKYGNDWASELLNQWYSGKDASFSSSDGKPQGHFLRQIRNHPKHGPAFYDAYNGEEL